MLNQVEEKIWFVLSEGFLVRSCNATMSLPFGTQSKNHSVWPTRIQGLVCRSICDKRCSTSIWQCRKVNCYISVLNQRKKNYSTYMFGQKYHSCTIKGNQIISSFICKDRKLKLKDGLLLKIKKNAYSSILQPHSSCEIMPLWKI